MNRRDRAKIDEIVEQLNVWKWPRALGTRPPRVWTRADNDDVRMAYRIMLALARWAKRQP